MKTYKHLTKEERCLIYFLWNKEKYSMNKIAKILNKNKSTISRELKRNTSSTGIYYSSTAHKNTLEENQIVICFLCWSTKTSQIFLFKNLILNLMV
ncbi:helix-turn-helix domain-containing protein [Malacoplasma iowae]|uniref:helix-turn-helix domain-containing protein n=1 Tax=Malacoplasma iowae TaxID=2116 RepID=UPI003873C4D9|nr:helix-turn-helix domain-containing protein [Malacoplasma iowae]WPL35780.1 helix-turn-helix domain-containing protein [Malacoplasma iowae]WPL35923.1 helix-turn-helix domain-containing protein [Malacoplasma iowae]WPL35994.1 helix-turn-helix domain-containing protein [Malacoplasma iowae]